MTKKEQAERGKLIDLEEKMHKAIEKRIEKKDRKEVERFLKAWTKEDIRELRRWERKFARD